MARDVANLRVVFSGDPSGALKAADQTERRIQGLGSSIRGVAGGILFAGVVDKIVRGVADLGGAALDFEANMANVDSIAQLSARQLDDLKASVLSISADPRISQGPVELAQGLYDIESSGFKGDAALTVLSTSAMAATAGITDTATAARATTAVLNAYSEGADQAGHVSDVLFQIVQDGVVTFPQLANNLGKTIPIAASLGVSFEELGAAYAQMTLNGVDAAQAETRIAALLQAASNPTDALTAAVQAHGYATTQDALAQGGLAELLAIVDETAGGNQQTMYDLLQTQEAVNAATILSKDHTKGYTAELKKMNAASKDGGATQKALERQMRSTRYELGQLQKNIQIGAIVAFDLLGAPIRGTIGALSDFAAGLTGVLLYVDDVVHGADRIGAAMNLVPEPLQRTARALALVVDGVADTVRAFREGGLQGAIDELGRIQGDRILGGLRALGEEAWGAFSGAVEGAAAGGVKLGSIALHVAGWVLGEGVPDLYDWLKGVVYGAAGGGGNGNRPVVAGLIDPGTEAMLGMPPISLGAVAVAVAGWAIGEAEDLYGKLRGQVLAWAFGGGAYANVGDGTQPAAAHDLGDIAVSVAGWVVTEGESLAGAIATKIGELYNAAVGVVFELPGWGIDLGKFLVQGGETLGNDVVSFVGDTLWPAVTAGAQSLAGWGVDLGTFLVQGGQTIWTDVSSYVTDTLWPTFKETAIGIGEVTVGIADLAVKSVTAWSSGALTTIQTWIDSNPPGSIVTAIQIGELKPTMDDANKGDWNQAVKDLLEADPIKVTPPIELNIEQSVEDWTRDLVTAPVDWEKAGIGATIFAGLPLALGTYATVKLGPDILRVLRAAFEGVMEGLFTGEDIGGAAQGFPMGGGGAKTPAFFTGLSDQVLAWFQTMADDITTKVGNFDFTGAGQAILQAVADGITGAVDGSDFLAEGASIAAQIAAGVTAGFGAVEGLGQGVLQAIADGISGAIDPGDFLSEAASIAAAIGTAIKDALIGWVKDNISIKDLVGGIAGLAGGRMGELGPEVRAAMGGAQGLPGAQAVAAGGAGDLTFTATFVADTQGVSDGFQFARAIGEAWDISVFPADFTADISAVMDAANFAWSIGNQWDSANFDASFSIDTSGLDAASAKADATAAHIRNVLPSSPAKEGPLRVLPTFQWLADDFSRTLDQIVGATPKLSSLAGLGGYGGPPYGAGGDGGRTVIEHRHSHEVTIKGSGEGADNHALAIEVSQILKPYIISGQRAHLTANGF